jgi:protein-S-isoprenylcysteine O-methyltransferase Ste14
MSRRLGERRICPALSTTDLLLLLVLVILMQAHLLSAIAGSLVALLFAVQHGIGAIVLLTHRPASQVSSRLWDTALGWAGTLLPLAMRATAEPAGWLSLTIVASGSLLATAAILSLGRSFGMEPAHRGLQTRGLYRLVRHPIYAAYLLIVGGFLTAHLSWWNGVVALIWLRVQVARIQREETLLRSDGHYQDYVRQVRWRLLPGMW